MKVVEPPAEPTMALPFDFHPHRQQKIGQQEVTKRRSSSSSYDASIKDEHYVASRRTRAFSLRATTFLALLILLLLGTIPSSHQQERGVTQRQHIFHDLLHNTIGKTNNGPRKLMKGKKEATMMLGKNAAVVDSIPGQDTTLHNFHNSKKVKTKTTLGTSQKFSEKSIKSSSTITPEETFTGVFAAVNQKPKALQQEMQPTSNSYDGWLQFQSTVLLELNVATSLNWTTMEEQQLEQIFTIAYNYLSSQQCDVYERQVASVDIQEKDLNRLLLHVQGKCYGCNPSQTTLLSSSSSSSPSSFGSLPPYYSSPQADQEQRDQRRPPSPYSSTSNTNTYSYAPIAINRRPPTEAPQSLSPTRGTLSPTTSLPVPTVVTSSPVNAITTNNNNRAGGLNVPTLSDRKSVARAQPIGNNDVEAKRYYDNYYQHDHQGRLVKKARSNSIKGKFKLRREDDPNNDDGGFSTSWSNTNDRRHHRHRHRYLHQIHAKNTQRRLKVKSSRNSGKAGGPILTTTLTTEKSGTAGSKKIGKNGGANKKSCKSKSKSKSSGKSSLGSSEGSSSSDCCSNANASYEASTENEMLLYLNHLLAQSTLPLRVDLVLQSLTKQCSAVEGALGSSLMIQFVGQRDQVTQNEISLIQKTIVAVYQRLQATQCDTPYFRQLTSAILQSVSEGSTPGSFLLDFTLQGTCRGSGCGAMIPFFQAAASRRRQLSSSVAVPYLHTMNRYTPSHEQETTCLCPAFYNNAGPPSIADFNEVFAQTIQFLIGQGMLQHIIASMEGFETGEGPAGAQQETFQSCIAIQFFGVANGVTENEVQVLQMVVPEVYNDLQLGYCDPLSRTCSSATVTYYDPNPASTQSFILGFQLEGTCLATACSSNGIIFFREGIDSGGGIGHFLQSSPTCNPGQTEGAPNRDEFAQALALRIRNLSNDGTLMNIDSSAAVNQDVCPTSMPTTIEGMPFKPTFSPSSTGRQTEAPTSPGAATAPSMVGATSAPSPVATSAPSKPGASLAPTSTATNSTPTSNPSTTAPTLIVVTAPTASVATSAPTRGATTTAPTTTALTVSPPPAQTTLTANPTSSATTMSPTGLRGSLGPTNPNGNVGTTAPTSMSSTEQLTLRPTVPGATVAPTISPTINETSSPTAANITLGPTLSNSTASPTISNSPSLGPSTNATLSPSALNVTLSPTVTNVTQSPTAPNVTLSPIVTQNPTAPNVTLAPTRPISNITVTPSAVGTLSPTVVAIANTTAPTLMANISNATLTPTQSPAAANVTLGPSVSNITVTPSTIGSLAPTVAIIANTTAPAPISNISNATLTPTIASISNGPVAPTIANTSNVTTAPSTTPGGGESLTIAPTISNLSTANLTSAPTVMETILMNTSSPTVAPPGILTMNTSLPTISVTNTTAPTQAPTTSFLNETKTTEPTQAPNIVLVNETNTTEPTSLPTQMPTGLQSLLPGQTNAPTLTGTVPSMNLTNISAPTIGPNTMTTVPTFAPTQVSNMTFQNKTAVPTLMPTGPQPLVPSEMQAPTPTTVGNASNTTGPTTAPNASFSNIPAPTAAPSFLMNITNIAAPTVVPSGVSTPAPPIAGQITPGTSSPVISRPTLTPTTGVNLTTAAPTLVGNFPGIPGSSSGPTVVPTVAGATPSPTFTATGGMGAPTRLPSVSGVISNSTTQTGSQTSTPTIAGTTNMNTTGNETTTVAPNSPTITTSPTMNNTAQSGQPTVTPTTLAPAVAGGSTNSPALGPSVGGSTVPSMSTNTNNMTNVTMGARPNNTTSVLPNNNGTTPGTTRNAPLAEDIWDVNDVVGTIQVMPGKFRKGNTGEDVMNDKKGYAEITQEEKAKWAENHEN